MATAVRTLVCNGFQVTGSWRTADALDLICERTDGLGVTIRYCICLGDWPLDGPATSAHEKYASQQEAHLVVVGQTETPTVAAVSWGKFLARLGGPVRSWLPLEPEYARQLVELGHNRHVEGIDGDPDELFEGYVHAGLQFMLGGRVRRYGNERRFERVPDGAVPGDSRSPFFLYDAKAAAGGFSIDAEAMRQFGSYVEQFRKSYEQYLGSTRAFLVVSGTFHMTDQQVRTRSQELLADCGVPLVFVDAEALAAATEAFAQEPRLRGVVRWERLLTAPRFTFDALRREIESRKRDGLAE